MMVLIRQKSRGAMLILTLGLVVALWFIVLGFANSSVQSLQVAQSAVASERAMRAAEAGLVETLAALKDQPELRSNDRYTKLAHTPEQYRVQIFRDHTAPIKLPTGTVYVVSHGRDRSGLERRAAALVRVGAAPKRGLLDFSVFTQFLEVNGGSSIDSFDSKVGDFPRGSQANIATNSTKPGTIDINGGSWIQGTIQVGPGGQTGPARPNQPTRNSNNVVWKNWNTWSLEESNLDQPIEYPPVQAPAAGTGSTNVGWQGADLPPGSYGDLRVTGGGKLTLRSGTYVFKSITLTGGATLAFEGTEPATIYVTEGLDILNGSTYNTSKVARNLLFMLADGVDAKVRGGANAYMVFYGPGATIDIAGGNHLSGAIVAKSVRLTGGSHFHYDVDLRQNLPPALAGIGGGAGPSGVSVISWQRF